MQAWLNVGINWEQPTIVIFFKILGANLLLVGPWANDLTAFFALNF